MLSPIPIEVIHFPELESTQLKAQELIASSKAHHGLSIESDYQSAGKGQLDGFWMSEAGANALFSMTIEPPSTLQKYPFKLSMLVALALKDYCVEIGLGSEVKIKWPNDIFVGSRKISGILINNQYAGQKLKWSILGVGFNVNQVDFGMLDEMATSLKMEGVIISVPRVLEGIYQKINFRYQQLFISKGETMKEEFNAALLGLDEERRFKTKDHMFTGIITGVNDEGRLLIQSKEEILSFGNKEVQWVM